MTKLAYIQFKSQITNLKYQINSNDKNSKYQTDLNDVLK